MDTDKHGFLEMIDKTNIENNLYKNILILSVSICVHLWIIIFS